MSEETGGPAFPFEYGNPGNVGMTLRDYFAAKALSSSVCMELSKTEKWGNKTRADWAYIQADEMLRARQE